MTLQIGSRPPPSPDDPLAFFLSCHRRLEQRLATLERAAAALEASPDEAVATLAETLRGIEETSRKHTDDEESSVWPRVIDDGCREALEQLSAEHRAVEAIQLALRDVLARLEPALHAELRAHVAALAGAYRDHVQREEQLVVPRFERLEPAELRAIGIEMRLRRG